MPYNTGETFCDECGDCPAPHTVEGCDRCPTDRGTEERYYTVQLCDKCARRYE